MNKKLKFVLMGKIIITIFDLNSCTPYIYIHSKNLKPKEIYT